jgi:phosphoglycolate phosphatase
MMSSSIAIVFDLDGTLVDTAPDLLSSLNAVLTGHGYRAIRPSELRHLVGHGVRSLFERAFEEIKAGIPHDRVDAMAEQFLDHYRANIARESQPFPKVRETLDLLAERGAGLGVCTNKPHDLTELLLGELDMARHFPAVFGTGRAPYSKPDPRHVFDVIEALKADRKRAVMVGDSPVDVAAARAAGIPVIAMSYGYTPVPAHELGADAVSGDFAELPGLISNLLR